jgi:Ca-activated chloride channel family protein
MLLNLHFIYPLWLLALVPALWLFILLRHQQEAASQWNQLIAPNLLPYLVDKPAEGQQARPYRLLVAALVLGILALAGPAWQREPSPFSEDEAPLVIAMELAPSMTVTDIQPSRLERGKQKVRDLLAQRSTGKTALVAYAGSAHLVMPLTDDSNIIETYLADLKSEIMPRPGNAPALALDVAEAALSKAPVPGSIVFITDGIGKDQVSAFANHQKQSQNDVVVLGIGTVAGGEIPDADAASTSTFSRLDRQGLDALSRQTNAYVTEVTTDATDIRRLNQHIQRHLAQVQESDSNRWRNEGHWLLYPLAVLMLFWFRQGWTIQWLTVFLVVCLIWPQNAIASPRTGFPPSLRWCIASAWAQPSPRLYAPYAFSPFSQIPSPTPRTDAFAKRLQWSNNRVSVDLWLTPDQQGRWLMDHGKFAAAAERFTDPLWKGLAYYVNSDFEAASKQLEQVTPKTPEVYFDLANAYAQQEDYKTALKYYDRALGMRSDYADAQANRKLVQTRYDRQQELAKERTQEQEGDLKADKVVQDDTPPSDQKNDHPRPNQDALGTMGMTDLWLQNVQTTPADFLRQKFQYQLQEESSKGSNL